MHPKYANFLSNCHGKELKWPGDYKLLYKATRDGDTKDSFYNFIEGKGNIFIFIKSNEGKSFGAYRRLAFRRDRGKRKDT